MQSGALILLGLGVAWAQEAPPGLEEVGAYTETLERRGIERLAVVTSDAAIAAMLESGAGLPSTMRTTVIHAATVLDDPAVATRLATRRGALCVLRVEGGDEGLRVWTAGVCISRHVRLSEAARGRFARVMPGRQDVAQDHERPVERAAGIMLPPSRQKVRFVGGVLAVAGAGLVGGTYGFYRSTESVTDGEWAAMQVLNTSGWVLVAGGSATVVVGAWPVVGDRGVPVGVAVGGQF